jgi:peptidoglycan hydrolase FlgJ
MSASLSTPMIDSSTLSNSMNSIPKINKTQNSKALHKQTNAFEALILDIVLNTALKDSKNIFSDKENPGDRIYQSMYRDEIARQSAGSFGISQMLYNYLSKKEKEA